MYRLLVILLLLVTGAVANAETRIPVEEFARLPAFLSPKISPDGLRLVSTVTYDGKPLVLVQKLTIGEDQTPEKPIVLGTGEYFIHWYEWANSERLIMSVRATDAVRGKLVNYTRLFSVSHDGENSIFLNMTPNKNGYYRMNPGVVCWLEKDPEHIYATLDENPDEWLAPEVDKVNIYTGEKKRILRNGLKVYRWLSDSDGNIRVGVRYKNRYSGNDVTVYYRDSNDDEWGVFQKLDFYEDGRLIPIGFHEEDPNILLVSTQFEDDGAESFQGDVAVYAYDLTLKKVTGPYVDERKKGIEALVEDAVPGRKIKFVSKDRAKNRYVLKLYSDVHIPSYYLLDLQEGIVTELGSQYPGLENAVLSPMEKVEYEARDGLKIPAFLTLPVNAEKENLPLVVYPHGGPWTHDEWGFDRYVQFFASRGYAVFQPQFRGSTGFGSTFEEAGYGQWGLKIQDDITDGVKWLIDQGIADPERIAIVGASFGGYAAAMGAAKTPDLYSCAVSINGVLDLKYFFEDSRSLYFESISRETWNDREDIQATSPYHMAENIQAPMLLIAGRKDTIVSWKHSKKMHKKLKKLKKDSQYIELENGEHWRTNEENEIVKLKALEDFLGKYL
jgi:dipeptidyl aminopeptidase/acylaminoacyl peptidase